MEIFDRYFDQTFSPIHSDTDLRHRIFDEWGIRQGDYGMNMGVDLPNRYSWDATKTVFVNANGEPVGGVVRQFDGGMSRVHISPKYAGAPPTIFREVVGHELIHGYHRYIYTTYNMTWNKLASMQSETVAYKYSAHIARISGRLDAALFYEAIALNKGFTQIVPPWMWYTPISKIPISFF